MPNLNRIVLSDELIAAYNESSPTEGIGMADFNFDTVKLERVDWARRGRKATPVPDAFLESLRQTVIQNCTATITIAADDKSAFITLLNKAGKQLNMRCEKAFTQHEIYPDKLIVHYRGRGVRNKELSDA